MLKLQGSISFDSIFLLQKQHVKFSFSIINSIHDFSQKIPLMIIKNIIISRLAKDVITSGVLHHYAKSS